MNPLPVPPVIQPIHVGPVRIDCPVILAPMTGVTDMPFRRLVRGFGSGLNVTEMIAEVVTACKLETTGHEIIKAVHPHPTMSEAIMEAVAEAYGECIHL